MVAHRSVWSQQELVLEVVQEGLALVVVQVHQTQWGRMAAK